jgi:hypothetical protein
MYSVSNDFQQYEFESIGPKGIIKKIIRFNLRNIEGTTYINIGFGDEDVIRGGIDDLSISNNKDRDKILATIASAVLDFTVIFPDMMVYAKGSTPARTRLYQMGIAANYNEVSSLLYVYGFLNGRWHKFERNVNYEAFFVLRKNA